MWDDIEINTKGDLFHYINNALQIIMGSADALESLSMEHNIRLLHEISQRLDTNVENLVKIRDVLAEKLPDGKLKDNEKS